MLQAIFGTVFDMDIINGLSIAHTHVITICNSQWWMTNALTLLKYFGVNFVTLHVCENRIWKYSIFHVPIWSCHKPIVNEVLIEFFFVRHFIIPNSIAADIVSIEIYVRFFVSFVFLNIDFQSATHHRTCHFPMTEFDSHQINTHSFRSIDSSGQDPTFSFF